MTLLPMHLFNNDFNKSGETFGTLLNSLSQIEVSVSDDELLKIDMLHCLKKFILDLLYGGKAKNVIKWDGYAPKLDFFQSLLTFTEISTKSRQTCFSDAGIVEKPRNL